MERRARVQAIKDRCAQLGLSVEHARRLAVKSRLADHALPWVLGLNPETLVSIDLRRKEPRRWLWMRAQSSSTSYREILTEEMLMHILTTGVIPVNFRPHMFQVLNEASVQGVVMAVEQVAQRSGIPIGTLWRHMDLMEKALLSEIPNEGGWVWAVER